MLVTEKEGKYTEHIDVLSDNDSCSGDILLFVEDVTRVDSDDKAQYIFTLCHYYINNFSTKNHPYDHKSFNNQKELHKISNTILKKEIKQRNPSFKLSNNKQPEMLSLFRYDSNQLCPNDMVYLLREKQE